MKKIYVLWILWLVFVVNSFGQISLVTSIDGLSYNIAKFTNTDESIGFVILNDSTSLKVYNEDFSFNRTINLNVPNFKQIREMELYNQIMYPNQLFVSTHLFNDNAALEFLVSLYDKSTGRHGFAIVDENSNILFSKYADSTVNGTSFSIMTTSNEIYLFALYYDSESERTEIYSLPGTERFDWSSGSSSISNVKSVQSKSKVYPFPNPAHSTINLVYTLLKGNMGTLSIYDLSGKCLQKLKVDGAFPYVTLDVSGYKPTTYLYTVECNGMLVTEKFIVSQ